MQVMENLVRTTVGMSTNIVWHECSIGKLERQNLLMQKGCVIWITGFSGSGKSTLASMLNRQLHCRGHVSYVLDGDNLRHGLNKDLSFKAEDRAENICRVGFTGIDDPYEPPMDCEIVIQLKDGKYQTPKAMAEQVVTYLEENGYLKA
ncbi:adenylyl-sulfate kinase 3-like isoform X7 [Ananas comosus]|uniref:Adenylyl-sulfate kinase 3-like isoform X7 n=1 Tax=Ananas comosus TaxID=4615 RepID=A0A6P5EL27_ANACO|nr:adenylyl-sulfate kinase 3-like isoform X7 [Ananas comosus]